MWGKRFSYKIIDERDYDFGNGNWVDDWFDFSYRKGLDEGLNPTLAESFAVHMTNFMSHSSVMELETQSYLKEFEIKAVIEGFICEEKDYTPEREQKRNVFFRTLELYMDGISVYEKRTVQVHAHLPEDILLYVKGKGVGDYVSEQSQKYLKDRTIHKEPYSGHKLKTRKDRSLHFLLTPSEYENLKRVDGGTVSNKILNLYLHDVERRRQKERRLEILERFFPQRKKS